MLIKQTFYVSSIIILTIKNKINIKDGSFTKETTANKIFCFCKIVKLEGSANKVPNKI